VKSVLLMKCCWLFKLYIF